MNSLELDEVKGFVNENIIDFHTRKITSLEELKLDKLLTKNPYLFKAKNISRTQDLITNLLTAFLSSSEEKLFGDFLESLAIFIAEKTCDGHKSTAQGVDLEFIKNGIHYVVSIKSGPNWGNSSQHNKLEQDLKKAVARLKQARRSSNIQAVLGICYGKVKTSFLRGYMKVVGQNFWYFISENENLYTDIIGPVGHRAGEHNQAFSKRLDKIINVFTQEFMERFCNNGDIDWVKPVQFNSGNFKSEKTPI